jgi:heme exporter protein A
MPAAATLADPAVRADNISRAFDGRPVLKGVSIAVHPGECLFLLGRNGAGKTTLLSILSGRLKPDSGTVTLAATTLSAEPHARATAGVVGHEPMLHQGLTLRKNLVWFARMTGADDPEARAATLLATVSLSPETADTEVRRLSRGQAQRGGLARALIADPPLLLLDEPFTGLDEPARQSLQASIAQLRASGHALILTCHETDLGLACSTHVALLHKATLHGPVAVTDAPAVVHLTALLRG